MVSKTKTADDNTAEGENSGTFFGNIARSSAKIGKIEQQTF